VGKTLSLDSTGIRADDAYLVGEIYTLLTSQCHILSCERIPYDRHWLPPRFAKALRGANFN